MAKFMCTHTVKGFTRDQYCQIAAASQQDPTVKGLESYANLTEGKIYCLWQAAQREAVADWFKKMNVPYDSIIQVELEGTGGTVQAASSPGGTTSVCPAKHKFGPSDPKRA